MANYSKEYAEALTASDKAIAAFGPIKIAYRTRAIGDTEFLAAKKVYDAAMAKFDLAYQAESRLGGKP